MAALAPRNRNILMVNVDVCNYLLGQYYFVTLKKKERTFRLFLHLFMEFP